MKHLHRFLLASAALTLISGPGHAQSRAARQQGQQQAETDAKLDSLQRAVADLNAQVQALKAAQSANQAAADNSAALGDLKRSTSDQYADLNKRLDALPKSSIDNGRFTYTSNDGRFSVALRSLVQFDVGYFAQGRNPASVDLNSGTNFRRAQLGFQGTVFRDWSYNFIYDFGGYGVEGRGYVYNAYLEYDGLKPFFIRAGAYTPPEGQEDQTSSGDLFFPERAGSVDVARNLAGAPGREAVSIFTQGDRYLASISYTGKKSTDGTSTGASVGTFDAQQALIGRVAWLALSDTGLKWLVEGHITEVLKPADPSAGSSASVVRFSDGPEVAVDASKTVDTGNIDANGAREFGFETAGTFGRFYGQGGWFRYEVDRRLALPDPHFTGWYAFLTYSLTGEQHAYDPATATFRNLRPASPLGTQGGFGAWEIAVRYSDIDLNFLPFNTTATGGISGGQQDVWTVGLNWYPNNAIKFQLDYSNIQANHPNAPANDISAGAILLRSQISF